MKILFFSDLHLANYRGFSTPVAFNQDFPLINNSRALEQMYVLTKIIDDAIGRKVDLIIFNGDLWDNGARLDPLFRLK